MFVLDQLLQLFPNRHGSVCVYMLVFGPAFFSPLKDVVQFVYTCLFLGLFKPFPKGHGSVYVCILIFGPTFSTLS